MQRIGDEKDHSAVSELLRRAGNCGREAFKKEAFDYMRALG
jgi:hypothetical protein